MPRILLASLCFAVFTGCNEGRDVEADVAAFLKPTEHPQQHGVRITPSPENPDVKVEINGEALDPNAVNPCPVGAMSRMGMTRQDIAKKSGASAVEGFEKIGAFDIPPDKPECAEIRRTLAQRRRDFLAQQQKNAGK